MQKVSLCLRLDIESTVRSLIPDTVCRPIVAAVADLRGSSESLAVGVELRAAWLKKQKADLARKKLDSIGADIIAAVAKEHGVTPAIIWLREKALPKTTSGKVASLKSNLKVRHVEFRELVQRGECPGAFHESGRSGYDATAAESEGASASITQFIETLIGGEKVRQRDTLESLGLDSLQQAQLVERISEVYNVDIAVAQLYQEGFTVRDLKRHIKKLTAERENLYEDESPDFRLEEAQLPPTFLAKHPLLLCLVHILLIPLLLLPLILAFWPTIVFVTWVVRDLNSMSYRVLLLPVAGPIFATALILAHTLLKWIVVGKLKPKIVPMWSVSFFRWWIGRRWAYLVDKALPDGLRIGTIWTTLRYKLLGMDISLSSRIDGSRFTDFDLVTVGKECTVDGLVATSRMIRTGPEALGLKLQYTSIGSNTTVLDGSFIDAGAQIGIHIRLRT